MHVGNSIDESYISVGKVHDLQEAKSRGPDVLNLCMTHQGFIHDLAKSWKRFRTKYRGPRLVE